MWCFDFEYFSSKLKFELLFVKISTSFFKQNHENFNLSHNIYKESSQRAIFNFNTSGTITYVEQKINNFTLLKGVSFLKNRFVTNELLIDKYAFKGFQIFKHFYLSKVLCQIELFDAKSYLLVKGLIRVKIYHFRQNLTR